MLHKSLLFGLVLLAGLVSATIERSEPVRETSEASRSKRWWGGWGLGGLGYGGLYGGGLYGLGFGYPYGGLGFWGKRDVEDKRDMHPIDMEHSKMKRDLDTMHKTSELIKEREADAPRSKRWFGYGLGGLGGLYGGWGGYGLGFGYPYGLGFWGKKRSTEERDAELKREEDVAEIEKHTELMNEKRLIEKESFRAEQIHRMNKRAIEETEIAKKDSTRSKRWFGLGLGGLYGGLGGFGFGYPYYGGFWKRDASEHIKEDSERSVDDDIVKRDVEERDTDVIEEPEIKSEDHVVPEPSEDRDRRWGYGGFRGGYRGFGYGGYGDRGFGGFGGYGRYRYFG